MVPDIGRLPTTEEALRSLDFESFQATLSSCIGSVISMLIADGLGIEASMCCRLLAFVTCAMIESAADVPVTHRSQAAFRTLFDRNLAAFMHEPPPARLRPARWAGPCQWKLEADGA